MPALLARCFDCDWSATGEDADQQAKQHLAENGIKGTGVGECEHTVRVEYACGTCGLEGITSPTCWWCANNKPRDGHLCVVCRRSFVYNWRGRCSLCERPPRSDEERERIITQGLLRCKVGDAAFAQRTQEEILEEERQRIRKKEKFKLPAPPRAKRPKKK